MAPPGRQSLTLPGLSASGEREKPGDVGGAHQGETAPATSRTYGKCSGPLPAEDSAQAPKPKDFKVFCPASDLTYAMNAVAAVVFLELLTSAIG